MSSPLADIHVTDGDLNVVSLVTRVVDVALDWIEAHLAAGRPGADRIHEVCRRVT